MLARESVLKERLIVGLTFYFGEFYYTLGFTFISFVWIKYSDSYRLNQIIR